MENRKDIGKAFREKIDGLEKSPSPKVWNSIHAELNKKKKRRILPFWIRTIGLTVLFLFLLLPFSTLEWSKNFPFFHTNETNSNPTNKNNSAYDTDKNANSVTNTSDTDSDNRKNDASKQGLTTIKNNSNDSGNTSRNSANSSGNKLKSTKFKTANKTQGTLKSRAFAHSSKTAKNKNKKPKATNKSSKKGQLAKDATLDPATNPAEQTANTTFAANQRTFSSNAESDLAQTEKKKDSLKEKKKEKKAEVKDEKKIVKDSIKPFSKFYVFGYVAPTYYGLFSNKSTLDSRLKNKSSTELTVNFGGYLGVNITEKTNLRLGVSLSKFNTTTKNVNFDANNFENIEYKPGVTNGSIMAQFNTETLDIKEEYSFLEIPFEIKYVVLDKKFGIEAIGGISTLYLNKNTIEVEKNGQSIVIGKRNNLLKVHFTTNFGAGFYYKISKNLRFNAEPIFKYHFSPSEESPKKISFGLQTGFQYNLNN